MNPEIFSAPWFSALASIIVIDLILAGDNALVIGLAARNVPAAMQKRVILWGTAGAIIVRALLTAAKLLKTSGGQFKFCEPTESVKQALDISGFHSLLSVYATEGEAIRSF